VEWLAYPDAQNFGSFRIRFVSATLGQDGAVIPRDPEAQVAVRLWMPAHGHGSSPVTVAPEEAVLGGFIASDVFFVMPGEWDVEIHLIRSGSEVGFGVYKYAQP
jgi:hypothetical protein